MKKFKIILFFLIAGCACLSSNHGHAQQTAQKYIRQTDYLLSLPDGYNSDSTKKWPLVIFLHGSGESGSDVEKVKTHGPPKLAAAGKKFPFILVSPQAESENFGWEADNLYHFLLYLKKAFRVDDDRIYLTGLSMGGFGTWALAENHPEEFAAILPICGGGDTSKAWRLRYTPIWCFHGALDNVVPLFRDSIMINAARVYNPSAKFTVYPDAYHNSWERTYNNDSVYTWLLSHKKHVYQETKLNPKILKDYTGTFLGENGDTISISIDSAGLRAKTKGNFFPLKAAGDNVFFVDEHLPVDLKFTRNAKGKYDSFTVFEEVRTMYRKVE